MVPKSHGHCLLSWCTFPQPSGYRQSWRRFKSYFLIDGCCIWIWYSWNVYFLPFLDRKPVDYRSIKGLCFILRHSYDFKIYLLQKLHKRGIKILLSHVSSILSPVVKYALFPASRLFLPWCYSQRWYIQYKQIQNWCQRLMLNVERWIRGWMFLERTVPTYYVRRHSSLLR